MFKNYSIYKLHKKSIEIICYIVHLDECAVHVNEAPLDLVDLGSILFVNRIIPCSGRMYETPHHRMYIFCAFSIHPWHVQKSEIYGL